MTAKKAINNPEGYLKEIRRKTRRLFTAEQKILIVMEALRAETSIAELCRKHGIQESTFYKWNKEFIKPARSNSPEIRSARPPQKKSHSFGKRTENSRRRSPTSLSATTL